jgi:hypothetical protein
MTLALALVLAAGTCPARAPAAGQPGLAAVAKLPAEAAMRENLEGKKLYRQERWTEAQAKYRAALAADPDFLDARLNLACAFSRQGHYAEAAEQAESLVRTAFVPWNREVQEAADLGILQSRKEYAAMRSASAAAATAWGDAVRRGEMFLARTKPPINVAGEGVLLLSLHQEIFSWIPETGRYFQVTAEDGHVLGFVRSADKRNVAYLMGSKLVRLAARGDVLRGLSLRVLELATMELGPRVSIPEDVARVELGFVASPEILVTTPDGANAVFRLEGARLEKIDSFRRASTMEPLVLTATGVEPTRSSNSHTGCAFELLGKKDGSGVWQLEVHGHGAKPFVLDARYGAAFPGLPFPDGSSASPTKKDARKATDTDNK